MGSTDKYSAMLNEAISRDDKSDEWKKKEVEYIISSYKRRTGRNAPAWMRAYRDRI